VIGSEWLDVGDKRLPSRSSMGLLTQPVSCIGLPVANVPLWGMNDALPHLPIGVQLIAAPWREDLVLRVAAQLQAAGVCSAPVATVASA
jgi:amidase/aspartyl-tRNA(Asn)/glutamyl-tRNA(Gln) amidotransferase subunit A